MPRDGDRNVFHRGRVVDQPKVEVPGSFIAEGFLHAADLFIQRAAHDQRVQVAETSARQQLVDGYGMRTVAIRPVVVASDKDCRQILDPYRPGLLCVVEESGLIGHVQIDWGGSIRDYGLCTAEMVR